MFFASMLDSELWLATWTGQCEILRQGSIQYSPALLPPNYYGQSSPKLIIKQYLLSSTMFALLGLREVKN